MHIAIPNHVEKLIKRLLDDGYDAYLVGGSIRNILMNKKPVDWDIASSAEPNEVIEMFLDKKVIKTGEKYGTVTVICQEGKVEVTTFRSEGGYSDGRHPDWVHYEKSIEKDLSRRDFTINAIAYNKKDGLVDPFGGIEDIIKKRICAVGNPEDRFLEDGLRMIRAVRFSAILDFEIEENTFNAIKKMAEKIKLVSSERIRDELFKILCSPNPSKGTKMLLETRLIKYILPEIALTVGFDQNNPNHDRDVFQHILCVLDRTPNLIHVRLAALFHDAGKPYCYSTDEDGIGHFYGHSDKGSEIASKALLRLKCPNDLIKKVEILVKNHMSYFGITDKVKLKKLISSIGKDNIFDLISLQKADVMCKKNKVLGSRILIMEDTIKEIIDNKEPVCLKDLAIGGNEIRDMGFDEGVLIGEILEDLMEEVLKHPEINIRDLLMEIVKNRWTI